MRHVLGQICALIARGETGVLVTVLEKSGSTPRGAGACMLVSREGAYGTIGGGAAEHAAQGTARRVLETGRARVETYRMSPNEAADLGMICGGTARVLFHPILPTEANGAAFAALRAAADGGGDAWLMRGFEGDMCTEMRAVTARDGGWTLPKPVFEEWDGGFRFCEPVSSRARVLVFGGGHVAQRLVPLLGFLGMRTLVFKDRAAFADPLLFPDADAVILGNFADISAHLTVRAPDAVVVMTRGHQADYAVLVQALRTEAGYIGCIGSRKKVQLTRERLLADGFSEGDIARIHSPIGLPIGGETPEEIAVSIAAELIQHRSMEGKR